MGLARSPHTPHAPPLPRLSASSLSPLSPPAGAPLARRSLYNNDGLSGSLPTQLGALTRIPRELQKTRSSTKRSSTKRRTPPSPPCMQYVNGSTDRGLMQPCPKAKMEDAAPILAIILGVLGGMVVLIAGCWGFKFYKEGKCGGGSSKGEAPQEVEVTVAQPEEQKV